MKQPKSEFEIIKEPSSVSSSTDEEETREYHVDFEIRAYGSTIVNAASYEEAEELADTSEVDFEYDWDSAEITGSMEA